MGKKQLKITINAPREKVWATLWNDATYRAWTAPFSEGSWADTDWKKGGKVLFLNGNNEGMVSTVAENIPNEFMSFKHLGYVKNGVEDIETAKTQGWHGAMENYTLKGQDGKTELVVDMDLNDEDYEKYFKDSWPKALEKLKALAESN
ncbi:SRPBCC family protein [Chitinophaga japonensis]|uniref:Activator of Hsp90 ATPase-like protein n=1 Tax=Chitinophaga japonensis TaxID=104662 RepID=A0A562STG6_CHIJA|nr:SRPBCC domain-containing protein [Chitinophaga japonensis]TWI84086.1 activator of Hsp90 ATPase-like protein [Chitinophaga japonensis]